ncbi:MAG: ABC transporter permease [Chloroflexi bacterium]|nr:ABC transporter permease [Chloroflexota bacterium]
MLTLARRKPLSAIGAVVVAILILTAAFADVISPYDPIKVNTGQSLKAPMTAARPTANQPQPPPFILGTDDKARDVLSRIIHGSRVSLWVGILSVGIGTLGGTLIGLVSGYLGGKSDLIIQRFVDALQAMPGLIFAMAIVSVLGPSTTNTFIAIGIILIPSASRIVRGATLSIKNNMYVDAARAMGATQMRILRGHVLPNVMAPIIVIASVAVGGAILTESSLSFLGLGTQAPDPSWGSMLSGTGRARLEQQPWLAFFPGMAISLVVFSFNMLGDGLRDVLDPRLRGR